MTNTEEISQRCQHTWTIKIIPGHTNQNLAIVIRIIKLPVNTFCIFHLSYRCNRTAQNRMLDRWTKNFSTKGCYPDMIDTARSLNICHNCCVSCIYQPVIFVSTTLIPAGSSGCSRICNCCKIFQKRHAIFPHLFSS